MLTRGGHFHPRPQLRVRRSHTLALSRRAVRVREPHKRQAAPRAGVGLGDVQVVVGRQEQRVRRREGLIVLAHTPRGDRGRTHERLQPLHVEVLALGGFLEQREPRPLQRHHLSGVIAGVGEQDTLAEERRVLTEGLGDRTGERRLAVGAPTLKNRHEVIRRAVARGRLADAHLHPAHHVVAHRRERRVPVRVRSALDVAHRGDLRDVVLPSVGPQLTRAQVDGAVADVQQLRPSIEHRRGDQQHRLQHLDQPLDPRLIQQAHHLLNIGGGLARGRPLTREVADRLGERGHEGGGRRRRPPRPVPPEPPAFIGVPERVTQIALGQLHRHVPILHRVGVIPQDDEGRRRAEVRLERLESHRIVRLSHRRGRRERRALGDRGIRRGLGIFLPEPVQAHQIERSLSVPMRGVSAVARPPQPGGKLAHARGGLGVPKGPAIPRRLIGQIVGCDEGVEVGVHPVERTHDARQLERVTLGPRHRRERVDHRSRFTHRAVDDLVPEMIASRAEHIPLGLRGTGVEARLAHRRHHLGHLGGVLGGGHRPAQRDDDPVSGLLGGGRVRGVDQGTHAERAHSLEEVLGGRIRVEGERVPAHDGLTRPVQATAVARVPVAHRRLGQRAEDVVASFLGVGRLEHPQDKLVPRDRRLLPVERVAVGGGCDVHSVHDPVPSRCLSSSSCTVDLPSSARWTATSTVPGLMRWWMTTG